MAQTLIYEYKALFNLNLSELGVRSTSSVICH